MTQTQFSENQPWESSSKQENGKSVSTSKSLTENQSSISIKPSRPILEKKKLLKGDMETRNLFLKKCAEYIPEKNNLVCYEEFDKNNKLKKVFYLKDSNNKIILLNRDLYRMFIRERLLMLPSTTTDNRPILWDDDGTFKEHIEAIAPYLLSTEPPNEMIRDVERKIGKALERITTIPDFQDRAITLNLLYHLTGFHNRQKKLIIDVMKDFEYIYQERVWGDNNSTKKDLFYHGSLRPESNAELYRTAIDIEDV